MTHVLINILLTVFVAVCVLLILAVLMQRSKQDGLGAAFGGGLTETVFGAQTSSVLVRFTSWLAGTFFLLAIVLAYLYGHRTREVSPLYRQLHTETAPAAPAAPETPAPAAPAPAPGH